MLYPYFLKNSDKEMIPPLKIYVKRTFSEFHIPDENSFRQHPANFVIYHAKRIH
jgi:hypothetical protein